MSDEKRTQEKINQDYTTAVARLGEIQYLMEKQFPEEILKLIKQITHLQKEAQDFQKRQKRDLDHEKGSKSDAFQRAADEIKKEIDEDIKAHDEIKEA